MDALRNEVRTGIVEVVVIELFIGKLHVRMEVGGDIWTEVHGVQVGGCGGVAQKGGVVLWYRAQLKGETVTMEADNIAGGEASPTVTTGSVAQLQLCDVAPRMSDVFEAAQG